MLVQIKIILVFIDLQLVAEIPKFGFGISVGNFSSAEIRFRSNPGFGHSLIMATAFVLGRNIPLFCWFISLPNQITSLQMLYWYNLLTLIFS